MKKIHTEENKRDVVQLHLLGFRDTEVAKLLNLGLHFVTTTTAKYWKNKMPKPRSKSEYVNPKSKLIKFTNGDAEVWGRKCSKCGILRPAEERECKYCKRSYDRNYKKKYGR